MTYPHVSWLQVESWTPLLPLAYAFTLVPPLFLRRFQSVPLQSYYVDSSWCNVREGLAPLQILEPWRRKNIYQEDRRTLRSPTVRLYKISPRMEWTDPWLNHGFKIFLDALSEWNEKDVSIRSLGKPWQFSPWQHFGLPGSTFGHLIPARGDSRVPALICWFVLGSDERGNGYVSTCREDRTEVGQTWHETRNKWL